MSEVGVPSTLPCCVSEILSTRSELQTVCNVFLLRFPYFI